MRHPITQRQAPWPSHQQILNLSTSSDHFTTFPLVLTAIGYRQRMHTADNRTRHKLAIS